MTVKELIEELKGYNPEAKVKVVLQNGSSIDFEVWCNGSDGVTAMSCDEVHFAIDCDCEAEE